MAKRENKLIKDLAVHLSSDRLVGLPKSKGSSGASGGRTKKAGLSEVATAATPSGDTFATATFATELSNLLLAEVERVAKACTRCRLCEGRTNVVFGVGNTDRPLIAFIGEGPGEAEDRQGEPFVGRAGALLTDAITKGMGLKREDIYIGNVVKCRPPNNRAPLIDEVEACTPYLYRQLELIEPQIIVTLGQPAQRALSGVEMGITKLRGTWLEWRGTPLMPTFHPAYILRNPSAKRPFWEDLQAVMASLGMHSEKAYEA